jgi:AcrR family transcriptional regulator
MKSGVDPHGSVDYDHAVMVNKRSFSRTASGVEATEKVGRRAIGEAESRDKILRAAEALFSRKGFHGTGLREVADEAGVSVGNIYNHFATKEALFEALLHDLEKTYLDPSTPLMQALVTVDFPSQIEKLGEASRETVKKFASYIRLIYVDVIEFEGKHIAKLYAGMADRYRAVFAKRFEEGRKKGELSDQADPVIAAMMSTILYMYYFTVEHLFGVKGHYGLDDDQVIREFAKVLRLGILKR